MPAWKSIIKTKYLVVAFAGALFAPLVWKIMDLEFRYAVAISGGLLVLSIGMMAIYRIDDFFVYTLIFNTPFSIFGKWLFRQDIHWGRSRTVFTPAMGISIGLAEMLIIGAYTVWFARIFIARKELPVKLKKIDYCILLLIFSQAISLFAATNRLLVLFDITYNIKHALIYFFIAHKVKRRHLMWIIIILLLVIPLESTIALYEHNSGNVGLFSAKGNIRSKDFGTQYQVIGIGQYTRACGTTIDSHTLGLYYTLLLPITLVLIMTPQLLRPSIWLILVGIFIFGLIGLVVTFARSGWLSFTISTVFLLAFITFSWKQYKVIIITIMIFLAAIPVTFMFPQICEYIQIKLFEAPYELIQARLDMALTALRMWSKHFLFGAGAGNYMLALDDPSLTISFYDNNVVHNAYLYIAAEIGLFGLISFYSIILIAMVRCWKMLKCEDLLIRILALAIFTGFIGYLLDGLTNPLFRQAVPYAQLWIYLGLSMSLARLSEEQIPASQLNVV